MTPLIIDAAILTYVFIATGIILTFLIILTRRGRGSTDKIKILETDALYPRLAARFAGASDRIRFYICTEDISLQVDHDDHSHYVDYHVNDDTVRSFIIHGNDSCDAMMALDYFAASNMVELYLFYPSIEYTALLNSLKHNVSTLILTNNMLISVDEGKLCDYIWQDQKVVVSHHHAEHQTTKLPNAEAVTGLPLTREAVTGLPLTREAVTGLPLTREAVTGLPLTREASVSKAYFAVKTLKMETALSFIEKKVNDYKTRRPNDDHTFVWEKSTTGAIPGKWRAYAHHATKSLDGSLFLPAQLIEDIVTDLDRFRDGANTYNRIGSPYKRSYLLCGPPRNGKSSTLYALMMAYNMDLYKISLANITCDQFLEAMSTVKQHSIVAFMDVNYNTIRDDVLTAALAVNDDHEHLYGCLIVFMCDDYVRLPVMLQQPGRINRKFDIPRPSMETVMVAFQARYCDEIIAFDVALADAIDRSEINMAEIVGSILVQEPDAKSAIESLRRLLVTRSAVHKSRDRSIVETMGSSFDSNSLLKQSDVKALNTMSNQDSYFSDGKLFTVNLGATFDRNDDSDDNVTEENPLRQETADTPEMQITEI